MSLRDENEEQTYSIIKSLQWLKDKNFVPNINFKKQIFELEHISIFDKSNEVMDWLKLNMLTSEDIPMLAKGYTGEYSHMKTRLNWLLQNYPEHSDIINAQLNKTSRQINSGADINDYGNEPSHKLEKKSMISQCAQS
jgi:hypothetical protein